ncbi:dioxygenase [Cytophagales bacterium WSM2-2]|nr:dioxygenase [Cytophagales bacterium WSM2-2]
MSSYIENLFTLKGKVAVVTGGTGVLGSAMCYALANAGAKVVILGRRMEAANVIVSSIVSSKGEAMAVCSDVMDADQLKDARSKIIERFGTIDILVNGAGGNIPGAVVAPDESFMDLKMNDFQKVMELNLTGTVLPSQIFGEVIVKNKRGVIINISSLTAFIPLTRVVGYSAAKAAVSNFTQWLAVEMAKKYGDAIRVNAIAPGFFLTEQNRSLLTKSDNTLTDRGKLIVQNTPFARFGKAEELCGTLLWLCSDAASFVSGAIVPVDGGYSAFSGV